MPSDSTVALLLLILAQFLLSACVSLYPPLLPTLLFRRPISVAAAFATFESAHLATNCLLRRKTCLRAGTMVSVGGLLASLSHMAFSAVLILTDSSHSSRDEDIIIFASVLAKVFEGVGCAVFKIGCFRVASSKSEGDAATALAALESSFGVGLACGPIIGGLIAGASSTATTIGAFGACLMLVAVPTLLLNDESEVSKQSDDSNDDDVRELLKRPVAAMSAASIACASFGSGLIAVGLAQHLLGEQRSLLTIGVLFGVSALSYGVSCPICGSLIDACSTFAHPIAFNMY